MKPIPQKKNRTRNVRKLWRKRRDPEQQQDRGENSPPRQEELADSSFPASKGPALRPPYNTSRGLGL